MLDLETFVAWLEHSSRGQRSFGEAADEDLNKWSSRPAQGKPVARRGRKARGLATPRRPSCQLKAAGRSLCDTEVALR
jgi:hypothetical protein